MTKKALLIDLICKFIICKWCFLKQHPNNFIHIIMFCPRKMYLISWNAYWANNIPFILEWWASFIYSLVHPLASSRYRSLFHLIFIAISLKAFSFYIYNKRIVLIEQLRIYWGSCCVVIHSSAKIYYEFCYFAEQIQGAQYCTAHIITFLIESWILFLAFRLSRQRRKN